jgi:hypothetical protein
MVTAAGRWGPDMNDLRVHPLECQYCRARFMTWSGLARHLQFHYRRVRQTTVRVMREFQQLAAGGREAQP